MVPAEEEETGLCGTTNPEEAKRHAHTLGDMLEKLHKSVREGVAEDIMKKTIEWFRRAIIDIAPKMEEVNVSMVLNSIKDTSCMVLMPQTEDCDERLEEIIPEEDLPSGSKVVTQAEELDDLTSEQPELLAELFDELEVSHNSLAKASSTLGRLSRSLSSKQLLTVLKASICPLIQINALENFWKDPAVTQWKMELPEDTHWRVKLTMIPDPMTDHET